ncbi:hypothetical protein F0267_13225 [Vibrio coralliilyticus]|uniref:Uncharacterized protein n=1 Tax=Vibrio coralliilyticus TaxID=190893 RepID=A0AAN0SET9_9VIBR|nr:hypothetical protein [Vibrio coralliilyticus]AIW20641.1 hypothetical protein IX92_16395 [Vibrio coralliilyticus]MCC2520562.1 hypothetical protein [Vibrio coralliilyticus]NOH39202.1 hypothetical protein [Vibrio coralliilyticus]
MIKKILSLAISIIASFSIQAKVSDGAYAYSCNYDSEYFGSILIKSGEATIEVSTNQIYIVSNVLPRNGAYSLYFKSADLGLGGVDIPFDKLDSSRPLATIEQQKDSITFEWLGAKDKAGNQVDIPFTALPVAQGTLLLEKCDN